MRAFAEILAHIREIVGVAPIRFYQKFISPAKPPSCRYFPSCSEYAIQAIRRYGLLGGSVMATARILRCHPWAKGGYDPLPAHFSLRPFAGVSDPAAEQNKNTEEQQKP